uniref:Poly(ADP-ribose) polymerase family member 3 n=1 Tax=Terrapene triunguis TaxID=2587831 RepID=A0A674K6E1_9SAUR
MAPKRKAPAKAQAQDKKVKQELEEDSIRSTVEALKTAPKEKLKAKIDSACQLSNGSDAQIHEDYDCMLNQTNIGNNNNKFYIIQLITHNGSYSCWNRWGRVGEVGQSKLSPFPSLEAAKKDFEKKFREKTKNSWAERENFVAHPGKYTLIEVQHGAEEEQEVTVKVDSVDGGKRSKQRTLPCSLDKATQELVSLIFSNDMFKEAMQTMNIDVKKMPLGKLSKQQIAKGFEALEAIETALQEQPLSSRQLEELSSRFYTIIPHSFGRTRPPTINTQEIVQAKKDMLLVLADIELAQSLQAQKKEEEEEEVKVEEVPHPLDKDYELLKCELTLVDPALEDYQVIQTYVEKTGSSYRKVKILNIWKVKREGEVRELVSCRSRVHVSMGARSLARWGRVRHPAAPTGCKQLLDAAPGSMSGPKSQQCPGCAAIAKRAQPQQLPAALPVFSVDHLTVLRAVSSAGTRGCSRGSSACARAVSVADVSSSELVLATGKGGLRQPGQRPKATGARSFSCPPAPQMPSPGQQWGKLLSLLPTSVLLAAGLWIQPLPPVLRFLLHQ